MIAKVPLIFVLGLSLHLGAMECDAIRTIPVRLFNDAAASSEIVLAAQNEAARVLRSLCVEIEWVRSPSTQAWEIRIIAMPLPHSTSALALGLTTLNVKGDARATVFFSRVRATCRPYSSLIRLDVLLGCVIAHEIGHMLLSTTAHSSDGVMVAHFGKNEVLRAAQRRLLFTRFDRETFSRSQITPRIYDSIIAAKR